MSHIKKFIVTAVGIGACTAVLVHLTKLQGQPAAVSLQKTTSVAGSTGFAGCATPEDALQSMGWAGRKGDVNLLRNGVTPDIRERLHDFQGPDMAAHAISVATELGGGQIVKKEVVSDKEVLLYVRPAGKDSLLEVRLQKLDGGWKLAGLAPTAP